MILNICAYLWADTYSSPLLSLYLTLTIRNTLANYRPSTGYLITEMNLHKNPSVGSLQQHNQRKSFASTDLNVGYHRFLFVTFIASLSVFPFQIFITIDAHHGASFA